MVGCDIDTLKKKVVPKCRSGNDGRRTAQTFRMMSPLMTRLVTPLESFNNSHSSKRNRPALPAAGVRLNYLRRV
ncbi:hypothetical protein EVAR_2333_1 [Eumeta japonica]|uniref:Uncharacterized protein n=1 Tax=Eumeta variegata TaxID=151549 RepID=A0A4C1SIV6_EUMVA|nr:hypothetical protein EVAR_2333_1 [Eumeta japonica]